MRTVITDTETLRGMSLGFIYNPFDKRLHAAACSSIARMAASARSPKWHFDDRAAAERYLNLQFVRSGAKRWQPAACCVAKTSAVRSMQVRVGGGGAPPSPTVLDEPITRRGVDFVEVWADEYVTNDSRAASSAGALRRLLLSECGQLPISPERILHAAYGGFRRPGKDIENLLFNDLDQTLSTFARLGVHGIRFEDLGLAAPQAPDGRHHGSYYRYGLACPGDPFAANLSETLCEVPEASVPGGTARLSARILVAVLAERPTQFADEAWNGPYALKVTVRGMSPGADVKAIVDGCSAALQQATPTQQLLSAAARIAAMTGEDEATLIAALTTGPAPLGRARRLLSLDGPTQVRVTPDDDRCVAVEIRSVDQQRPPRLAVQVWKTPPR